jgi:hypothetical protein
MFLYDECILYLRTFLCNKSSLEAWLDRCLGSVIFQPIEGSLILKRSLLSKGWQLCMSSSIDMPNKLASLLY